ncbi:hypothetical protein HYX13_04360 [Candidatus Woesearchaeota archaeon]|nr:hypothetical protein [Candidatus Woesearchaeota archaeon]
MNKEKWLKELYETHGDFELQRLVKVGDKNFPCFKNWVWYSQATEEQIHGANLRSYIKREMVLDLDSDNLRHVLEKLNSFDLYYEVFDTSSRGHHVRLLFKELENVSEEVRKKFREFMCDCFDADKAKGSNRTQIAIEYCEHFKSGKLKVPLVELSKPGENSLLSSFLLEFLEWLGKKSTLQHTPAPPCVGVGETKNHQGEPSQKTIEKLKNFPRLWELLKEENVPDRSGKDFLLAKFCVEQGITFDEYVKVLLTKAKWSKAHIPKHGIEYARRTFRKAYQTEYGSEENIK